LAGEVCFYLGNFDKENELPPVVCRLYPQRLDAITLALQVDFNLHFLLLFALLRFILSLNFTIFTMEMKTARPPRKPPPAMLKTAKAGKPVQHR
jgi:hypothetical protein